MNPKWEKLILAATIRYPKLKVVAKEKSALCKFLYFISLMKYWNKEFITHFTTTIGKTIYMPSDIIGTLDGYDVLRHELIHVADSDGWKALVYYPSYFILPIGPSIKAYWEYRAYVESMRADIETFKYLKIDMPMDAFKVQLVNYYAAQFTGSNYAWMFPFPSLIKKYLNNAFDKILKE